MRCNKVQSFELMIPLLRLFNLCCRGLLVNVGKIAINVPLHEPQQLRG